MTALGEPIAGRPRLTTQHRRRVVIGIPCLEVGGTEVHTRALARALRTGGYDVSVCCYHEHDRLMVESFRDCGIAVDLLDIPRPSSRLRSVVAQALARRFARLLAERKPDIAHIQYMAPGALAVGIARAVGVSRVVATVHVTASHYGNRKWIPRLVASRVCDAFLCVSKTAERSFFGDEPALFDELAWRAGRRHYTIHNCVELGTDEDGSEPPRVLVGGPVVGIVGRFDSYKGHDVLLDAMTQIIKRFPGVKLLCVGDGERRDALQLHAQRLGISEHVIWTGRVRPEEVPGYLRRMDVVAMPSRPGLEGFGLAAAEAMAQGKPVVASDVDALSEVIGRTGEEAGGVLVPAGDSALLASALERLLQDSHAREVFGSAGRRRVERLFSPQTFADRHLRLYAALCGAGR